MLFLISLVIAACFAVFCGETLRKHPAPFYAAAAVMSIGAVCVLQLHPTGIPDFLNQYVIAQFTKGTLAAACWAVVMWTGAISNQNPLMKKLMPQRGQLSIFSAILTLGHAAGYGISFFPRWLQHGEYANFIVCVVLMLIMIPLTVLSVRKIRKKLKPTKWKAIQRTAYLFYFLIPAHVLLVNFKLAKAGRSGAFFSLLVYAAVFVGYAVCRIRKWYLTAKKPERHMGMNVAAFAAFAVIFSGICFAVRTEKPQTTQAAEVVPTEIVTAVSSTDITTTALPAESETKAVSTTVTASESDTTTAAESESTAASASETSESDTTETEAVSNENNDQPEEQAAQDIPAQPAAQQQDASPEPAAQQPTVQEPAAEPPAQQQQPDPEPAPSYRYRNGTFSGSAYGYDGMIHVEVTIQDDVITNITGTTDESEAVYFIDAQNFVVPAILNTQSPDVDALSGATFTSQGIMGAVRAALESALNG